MVEQGACFSCKNVESLNETKKRTWTTSAVLTAESQEDEIIQHACAINGGNPDESGFMHTDIEIEEN